MKIVIDIPERYYDILKKKTAKTANEPKTKLTFMGTLCEAVGKGTPLTEIFEGFKTEIENELNPYLCIKECGGFAGGYYDGLAKTLKIINRNTGKESEE